MKRDLVSYHFASSGKSGIMKKKKKATTQVNVPSRMKIHLQPEYPLMPSILPIAEARRPPKAPARLVLPKKKEYRFCASDLLYHMPIR